MAMGFEEMLDILEENINKILNPAPDATHCGSYGCYYNSVCDHKPHNCAIALKMCGKPIPPEFRKIDDEVELIRQEYIEEISLRCDELIELVKRGSYKVSDCERECLFGEKCDKKQIKINGSIFCYADIAINIDGRFTEDDFDALPSEITDLINWCWLNTLNN